MIEPEVFYSNEQTSDSNHYQKNHDAEFTKNDVKNKALEEFHGLKNKIEENGIKVTSMKGIPECPDHIFPNWFITFENKTFQLFSMKAVNRRLEKTKEMIEFLSMNYSLSGDLTEYENKDLFLEATSSMVIDRVNMVVYAAISSRTSSELTKKWCDDNNYELVLFETESHKGGAIYHTDVFMYVGQKIIGICFDVILPQYRQMVKEKVNRYHDIYEIEKNQILHFCGNSLEAKNNFDEFFLIMSSRAFNALNAKSKRKAL
jgi:hypothetical protein